MEYNCFTNLIVHESSVPIKVLKIRKRNVCRDPKTMVDKLMYIPNDKTQVTSSIDENLKRLKTQFNKLTNKNSPKLF